MILSGMRFTYLFISQASCFDLCVGAASNVETMNLSVENTQQSVEATNNIGKLSLTTNEPPDLHPNVDDLLRSYYLLLRRSHRPKHCSLLTYRALLRLTRAHAVLMGKRTATLANALVAIGTQSRRNPPPS